MASKEQIRVKEKDAVLSPPAAYKDVNPNWNTMFQRLIKYKEQNGDCLVPTRFYQDLKLGCWVSAQREAKLKMNSNKKQLLDSINFVWSIRGKYDRSSWDDLFGRLVKYKEHHGHCKVPQRYKEDPKLGNWVDWQRRQHEQHKLPDDRKQRLDEIGFVWTRRKQVTWERMFERLVDYKSCNGHTNVEQKEKGDPQLGVWVKNQRANRCKMPAIRRQKLDDMGFWWAIKTINIEDIVGTREPLQQKKGGQNERKMQRDNSSDNDNNVYSGVHDKVQELPGHIPIANHHPGKVNKKKNQTGRKGINDDESDNSKRKKLQPTGRKSPKISQEDRWINMLEKLMLYKMHHGNCLVPKLYPPDPKLGRWVDNQRFRKKQMPAARRKTLDNVGFVWKLMTNEDWDVMLERLKKFQAKHGHTVVPTKYDDDFQLGQWVKNQRKDKLKLTQERKQRLQDISFVWSVPKYWKSPRIATDADKVSGIMSNLQDECSVNELQDKTVKCRSDFCSFDSSIEMGRLVSGTTPQPNNNAGDKNGSSISECD